MSKLSKNSGLLNFTHFSKLYSYKQWVKSEEWVNGPPYSYMQEWVSRKKWVGWVKIQVYSFFQTYSFKKWVR